MRKTKEKIYIVFGLHAYQPPTQNREIVEQIDDESYKKVAETILNAPESTIVCADIALSLLEQLEKYGRQKTIDTIYKCVQENKIQFVNTAAYHPLFPLMPNYYIKRQLRKNLEGYKKYFGALTSQIKGVFPPEMAFSERIIAPVKEQGANWLIADDTTFCSHYRNTPPHNQIIKRNGLYVFLMSHLWHKTIAFGEIENGRRFLDSLKYGFRRWIGNNPGYIILWMDWETFGHHDKKPKPPQDRINNFLAPFLNEIASSDNFEITTPDKLISLFPTIDVFVPDGSWSTSPDDYLNNIAWPLWLNPRQFFHELWWNLANYILSVFGETADSEIEDLIDKALYSCQTWQWSNGNLEIAKRGLLLFQQLFEHPTVSNGVKEHGLKLIKKIREL